MGNHAVELVNINKRFGDNIVLDDINLYIRDKEFLTLLGPSGCGKTTTLRLIGGFETPTSGKILFEGKDISNVPPYERNINTVFQKYALFPNMNVYENIAFGLRIKKMQESIINEKVKEMLRLVNLKGYEKRSILSLSGGQQQRIAIARALVNEPKVLLLDEPLGALDLQLRKDMQVELKNIQKRVGITFVYVTHDQEEALTMSDTIVVMNDGKIQQVGTPIDIYNEPKNAFIASFIGESNILGGVMNEDFVVSFSNRTFKCVDKGFAPNEEIDVVIRPEDLELVDEENGMLVGIVKSEIFKGVHYELLVKVGEVEYMVHSTITKPIDSKVGLRVTPDNIHIMKKGAKEI
ncbi:spermidine/putrescine ABC transporter ATP-binding protein [Parvimonas sp. D2]|uniref:spermidine/putrescine ABC transporter ATP-binding protein n=1 Tax=unclassified Parvimonas TaxID=1151464 RepID=UPI002B4A0B49|nr:MULTISPECIES: spermidine/putrescine ABC transporter ATP-binding protein [unclassified Parvimonas]MEB3011714.1 spermidine/putrescine ABC transporter ATP-binding protein [Parvimonas sp. D2]MEB3087206.1 spermidine/putrescine ABC transporter ATP-binding protein [Parvimonas sp. D4]